MDTSNMVIMVPMSLLGLLVAGYILRIYRYIPNNKIGVVEKL